MYDKLNPLWSLNIEYCNLPVPPNSSSIRICMIHAYSFSLVNPPSKNKDLSLVLPHARNTRSVQPSESEGLVKRWMSSKRKLRHRKILWCDPFEYVKYRWILRGDWVWRGTKCLACANIPQLQCQPKTKSIAPSFSPHESAVRSSNLHLPAQRCRNCVSLTPPPKGKQSFCERETWGNIVRWSTTLQCHQPSSPLCPLLLFLHRLEVSGGCMTPAGRQSATGACGREPLAWQSPADSESDARAYRTFRIHREKIGNP